MSNRPLSIAGLHWENESPAGYDCAPFAQDRVMSTRGDLSMLTVRATEDDFNQRMP